MHGANFYGLLRKAELYKRVFLFHQHFTTTIPKFRDFTCRRVLLFHQNFTSTIPKFRVFNFTYRRVFLFHQNFSETMLRLESSIKFKTWFKEFSVNNIHVSGTTVLLDFRLAACYLRSIIHQNYSQNVGQSICFNS